VFTGIVEETGRVRSVDRSGGILRLHIEAERVLDDLAIGDSVAVAGCCLTVVGRDGGGFEAELSTETLEKTAPRWEPGSRVNLERALRADGRFGGHIVSGHVEGVGHVLAARREPGSLVLTVAAPPAMAPYLIPKGSITVDGVSLTVVDVGGPGGTRAELPPHAFTLWLIPHTLAVTTLGELREGSAVNLESDVLARYAERWSRLAEGDALPEGAASPPRRPDGGAA